MGTLDQPGMAAPADARGYSVLRRDGAARIGALRVLGIDPGTRRMGFGVVERAGTHLKAIAHGVADVSAIEPFPARLAALRAEILRVTAEFKPDCAAIEEVFAGRNVRSAIIAAEGRGVVLLTLHEAQLAIHEYAPRSIKLSVTGRGAAAKEQVQDMVTRLLALQSPPAADAADALAVALCHLHRARDVAAPARHQ